MATRINLLPWRQEQRQRRQREFLVMLAGALIFAAAIVYAGDQYYQRQISHQEERNDLLRQEISKLDEKLKEISELQETKQRLTERIQVIQRLQEGRPKIVHLFEEFVTTLPDNVYLKTIKDQGGKLNIQGVAISNNRIADYMTNLGESPWFGNPDLGQIEDDTVGDQKIFKFSLAVKTSSPGDGGATSSGSGQ